MLKARKSAISNRDLTVQGVQPTGTFEKGSGVTMAGQSVGLSGILRFQADKAAITNPAILTLTIVLCHTNHIVTVSKALLLFALSRQGHCSNIKSILTQRDYDFASI